jgi:predicted RNA binding protein YcfA (HicA-like mRNA interferase family)
MLKKIRELISQLESAGFVIRGGKGSRRNFMRPNVIRPVVISGKTGDDAKKYQERAVESLLKSRSKRSQKNERTLSLCKNNRMVR